MPSPSRSPYRLLLALAMGSSPLACGDASELPPGTTPADDGESASGGDASGPDPASGSPPASPEVERPRVDETGDADSASSDPAQAEPGETPADPSGDDAASDDAASDASEGAAPCEPPEGASGSPTDVDQLVAWLNALPRPTSLPCFLQSLERPLELFLTRSTLSAQPAAGPENPRTFIVLGSLTLSVVASGRTRSLLEVGYASTPGRSIKSELAFPLRGRVTAETLTERVDARSGTSSCGSCHLAESDASSDYYAGAVESNEIEPYLQYEVTIDSLRAQAESCDPGLDPERCDMLSALFDHGELRRTARWAAADEYE